MSRRRSSLETCQCQPLAGVASPPERVTETLLGRQLAPGPQQWSGPSAARRWQTPPSLWRLPATLCRDGQLLAACLTPKTRLPPSFQKSDLATWLSAEPIQTSESTDRLPLFQFPHDVIAHHPSLLEEELQRRIETGSYREIADGVFVGRDVSLAQYTVTDSHGGPIVIESGAIIGAFAVLKGPILIEQAAHVNEHALIRDAVSLGHTTRVGGEVEASIIGPYSNKQHYGFLGHSYVGSWVNLGAGTCNSDLKNTYGTIRVRYGDRQIDTRTQFVGAIIGDYVKTAINVSIYTGKTIGPCSMLYGTVAENVAPFVNYAKQLGSVTEITPDVIIMMQQRMFARRHREQQETDRQLIRDMFQRSSRDREGLVAGPPELADSRRS